MPMYETQLMDEYFAGVSSTFCVSLMDSHLLGGQTNYYTTVLVHNCIQLTNDL